MNGNKTMGEFNLFDLAGDFFQLLDEKDAPPHVGVAAFSTAMCMVAVSLGVSEETLCEGLTRTYRIIQASQVEPLGGMQ